MKLRVKLLYIAVFTLFAAAIALMAFLTFTEPPAAVPQPLSLPDRKVFTGQPMSVKNKTFPQQTSVKYPAPPENAADLSGKIQLAAHQMIKSLLPEYSAIEYPGSLHITSDRTARVTLSVIVPATPDQKHEKRYRCQITVHFSPGGGCEALFPTFTEVQSTARPTDKNQQ